MKRYNLMPLLIWTGLLAVITYCAATREPPKSNSISDMQSRVCSGITSRAKYMNCLDNVARWEDER